MESMMRSKGEEINEHRRGDEEDEEQQNK